MNDPRFADYFPNLKSATAGNGLSALEQQKKKIAELEQAQLAASKAVILAEQKVQQHKNGRSKNHKDMSSEEEPSTSSSSSTSPTYSTSSTTSSDDEDNPVRFSQQEVSAMLARMGATHKRPAAALSPALQPPQQKQKSQEQPQQRPQQQLEEESESLGNDSKEEAEMIVAEEEVAEEEVETDSEEQAAELRANKKLVEQARKKRASAKAKSGPPKQPLRTRSAAAATPKKAVPPRGAKGNVRPSVAQPEVVVEKPAPAPAPSVAAEKKPASQSKKQPRPVSSPKVQSQSEKEEEEKPQQAMQVEAPSMATAKSAPQQKQQELTLVIEARKSLETSIAEMERLSALNALLKEELRKKQVELQQRESNVVGLEAREQELKKSQWSMDVNHASKTEEFEKKEASLVHREQTLAKREIELEKQATVDRQNAVRGGTEKEAQLKQREEAASKKEAELFKRALELTEDEKGLEKRESAVQKRDKQIQAQNESNEKEKTRLHTLSETLGERGRKQLVILKENEEERAHLVETRNKLERDMDEYRKLQVELNERTNSLKTQEANLQRSLEALEVRGARVLKSEAEWEQKKQSSPGNAVEQRVEQMKRDNVKHFNSMVRNYLTPMQFEAFFPGLLDETLVLNTFIDSQYTIVLLSVRASGQELFRQVQLLDSK